MSKYSLFVISVLLLTMSAVALGADCGSYQVYPDGYGDCYYTAMLFGSVAPGVQTQIDVTNTTSKDLRYRLDYNKPDGYSQDLMTQVSGKAEGVAGIDLFGVMAGRSRTIQIRSPQVGDSAQFSIRLYVFSPSPEILDQQKDSAVRSKVVYTPTVTTELSWSYFNTAVREDSLGRAAMGKITETPMRSMPTVTDKHNMFMLLNTGSPQKVRISVIDDNGNTVCPPFITRQLGKDEMYESTSLQTILGNSMFPGGMNEDVQVRVLFEGLGEGAKIFVQNLELLGGPYAVSTTPIWTVE